MEKILSLSEAKTKLNSLVDEVILQENEFIITKNGKPAAILVSPLMYEGWKETEEIYKDSDFLKEIKQGIKRLKKGKTLSFEEVFGDD
ncbi:type II toxin-antitoxin system Phd/YefM family antitoxin [bacterium]|nr:type II toxin-antitoxin system Phd/YefM family antitoxin [bacterium]